MDNYREIKMSSFLAALFLIEDGISFSFSDISRYWDDIFIEKKIEVIEEEEDMNRIAELLAMDSKDKEIYLTKKHSDLISVDNQKMTVYDYLHSLATQEIIEYFEEKIKKQTKVIA